MLIKLLENLVGIFFCFAVLCVSTFVQVTLWGYDYSLLFILCFLLTQIFKKNYALLAVILYLLVGLSGLPIFAFGGGWQYIFEPSFGFLLALVPLSLLAFYYKHSHLNVTIRALSGGLIKTITPLAIVIAHLFGFIYLLITGNLNVDNFLNLNFHQFIYDLIFSFIIITIRVLAKI